MENTETKENIEIKENIGVDNASGQTEASNQNAQEPNTNDTNAEAQSESKTPSIEELKSYADELGLGEFAEVLGDNPDKLHKFLIAKEKKILENGRGNSQQNQGQDGADDSQSKSQRDNSAINAIEKFEFKFKNPGDVDPELLQNLNDFRDQTFKYLESLVTQVKPLDGIVSTFEEQRIITENTRFENSLSKLGNDYSEFVGIGSIEEISKEQLEMRNLIYDTKEALRKGMINQGLKVPTESRLVEKAAKMVFEDKKIDLGKKKLINDAKSRQNQVSLKPNSRQSESALSAEEQAIRDFDKRKASIVGSD